MVLSLCELSPTWRNIKLVRGSWSLLPYCLSHRRETATCRLLSLPGILSFTGEGMAGCASRFWHVPGCFQRHCVGKGNPLLVIGKAMVQLYLWWVGLASPLPCLVEAGGTSHLSYGEASEVWASSELFYRLPLSHRRKFYYVKSSLVLPM